MDSKGQEAFLFRAAFDQAVIGMALVSLDGRWLKVNRSLCELLGYSEQELLATDFQSITPHEDAELDDQAVRQLVSGQISSCRIEKRYRHKDGHIIWVIVTASIMNGSPLAAGCFIVQILDITAQRHHDQERIMLASLVESTPDFAALAKPGGEVLFINRGGRRMLGISDEAAVAGTRIPEYHPDWSADAVMNEGIPSAIRDGVWQGTSALKSSDGRVIPVAQVIAAHNDGKGGVNYLSTIMHDLSSREEIEKALSESEARFRAIYDGAPMGIAVSDLDGHIMHCNSAMKTILGSDDADLQGLNISDYLFHEEARERFSALTESMLDESDVYQQESLIMLKDGQPKWGRWSISLVRASETAQSFHVVLLEDVSEQKAFEQAMQRIGLQYELILNAAGEGIVGLDAQGNVTFVNPSGARMLGHDVEDVVGQPVECVFRLFKEDGTALLENHDMMIGAWCASAVTPELECKLLRGDESMLDVDIVSAPIMENDRPAGSVVLIKDITARKQAEIALREGHEKLESAYKRLAETQSHLVHSEKMASIGQLAAGVAHEINNPLSFVFSNFGTLDAYMSDLMQVIELYESCEQELVSRPEISEKIQSIKERVELAYLKEDVMALIKESKDGLDRVRRIVQDLRDFSHADTRDDWQMASLHHCLDSTLNIIWNELKYKAEIIKEYADLPDIECLPSQMNQVFMNMLINAGHAIENKGRIHIRTGREDGMVWVEIEDDGKGIDPYHIGRIFDPFYSTKPIGKGTGLGLSVSYNIVKKHHGRIDVESEPGKGAKFRISIPVRRGS